MIDLDIVFVVLTFGCILFVLQTLLDYNKRASAMRPQLNEVLRIKERHKEELEKVQRLMDESEKEASKSLDDHGTGHETRRTGAQGRRAAKKTSRTG